MNIVNLDYRREYDPLANIAYLLKEALTTDASESDRMLVVQAANSRDFLAGTNYGRAVVAKLMKNAGIPLSPKPLGGSDYQSLQYGNLTTRTGKAYREAALAIGNSAGPKTLIVEYLEQAGTFSLTDNVHDLPVPKDQLEAEFGFEPGAINVGLVSAEYPCFFASIGEDIQQANLGSASSVIICGSAKKNRFGSLHL